MSAGTPARPTDGQPISPSSIAGFAYLAVPAARNQTGLRAFCGDSSGIICYTGDGSTPGITNDGQCDQTTCALLR